MRMFDVKKYEFEFEGEKYKILPLNGDDLEDFYEVALKMKEDAEGNVAITGKDMKIFHKLTLKTFEKSYPSEFSKGKENMESFVSQNLTKLIEHLVKVNMPE